MKDNDIIEQIYKFIFLKDMNSTINIFLCGSNPKDTNSLRHKINNHLKEHSNYNIAFPEEIFESLLKRREYNLLELESDLANDVDIVILPLEGLGTYAELGAFSTYEKLQNKIVVINQKRYRHKKNSFINMGPIKLIERSNKKNIIYYDDETQTEMLDSVISRIRGISKSRNRVSDTDNLFNLMRFILYIIAFFQPITINKIKELLEKYVAKRIYYIQPCIDLLIEKKHILSEVDGRSKYFKLSSIGNELVFEGLLKKLNLVDTFSEIRARVVNKNYRKLNKLNLGKERKKFLELVT